MSPHISLLLAEQEHFCFKNKMFPRIEFNDQLTLRPEEEMGKYRFFLDKDYDGLACSFLIDYEGEELQFDYFNLLDKSCVLCAMELSQAEKWLYPCKIHGCHLPCFSRQKAENAARHDIIFHHDLNPDGATDMLPGGVMDRVMTQPNPAEDWCPICKDSLDYEKGPLLTAVSTHQQDKFNQLKVEERAPWFIKPYGVQDYVNPLDEDHDGWLPLTLSLIHI